MSIVVNGRIVAAEGGELLLHVLRRAGVEVPTLCHMEGLEATGACRLCAVEVEGEKELVPSCSCRVRPDMVVTTHSPRAVRARRSIVELLLAAHPDDCLYCVRNGSCRLQELARELGIHQRRFPSPDFSGHIDASSPAVIRDADKCILCSRCVRVCGEVQTVTALDFTGRGTDLEVACTLGKGLNVTTCVACGQCVRVCPTGALHERLHLDAVIEALADPRRKVFVQLSSAAALSLAPSFGLKAGVDLQGRFVAAMGALGFDRVFDSSAASDLLLREQAREWAERLGGGKGGPFIATHSPAVVSFIETYHPDLLPFLSRHKSSRQILGAVARRWLADVEGFDPDSIVSVAVSPCVAAKAECLRDMVEGRRADVDHVLTIRELQSLMAMQGIDPSRLDERPCDRPFVRGSSAGRLVILPGGWAEGLLRSLHPLLTGRESSTGEIRFLRGTADLRTGSVSVGSRELSVAVASGLGNVRSLLDELADGTADWDLLDLLACSGGCLYGGGQLHDFDEADTLSARRLLLKNDRDASQRLAHRSSTLACLDEGLLDDLEEIERERLFFAHRGKRDVLR